MRRRTIGEIERDGRRNNGGARRGAGRPVSDPTRLLIEGHLMQEVIVKELRHGQVRRVKKRLIKAMLDSLVRDALRGNVRAARAYFDITLGKPRTPGSKPARFNPNIYTAYMALPKFDKPPSLFRVSEAESKKKPRN